MTLISSAQTSLGETCKNHNISAAVIITGLFLHVIVEREETGRDFDGRTYSYPDNDQFHYKMVAEKSAQVYLTGSLKPYKTKACLLFKIIQPTCMK